MCQAIKKGESHFMAANRRKLIAITSLIILLWILGCIGPADFAPKNSDGNLPIRVLRITIDEGQREELFARLREFADKHAFEFLIREAGPNGKGFFVEMLRDDLYINAVITRVDPKIVSIGFYNKDPANATPAETIDKLLNDLKNFISEIPNVTITEEK